MSCPYIKQYYVVPADIGRRVVVNGKPGIIAADCGHYIGVNFDADEPGHISHCHPTWRITYGEMGFIRKLPKRKAAAKARYKRFLEYGDSFDNFMHFCAWDSQQQRSWNGGAI
ncbi:hypothetical protein [Arsukibacterium indicum]|uniref:Uncharacterized protein n=1 Tax=Arsukibacterium indicum TaxID=2848612 RepID=A0ABS6MGL1_9GAMM|nr:hypothetical protein [Arsukibacterium indicum]MBV2127956.1 hypothetical protein [Arsukibacterium indicum]